MGQGICALYLLCLLSIQCNFTAVLHDDVGFCTYGNHMERRKYKTNRIHIKHVERVKKAYPAYFDTYAEMQTVIDYLNGIDNLYCIGRNGQHRYNNMDHSMVTAFEAVELITGKKDDRNELWNVNTEKEYYETRNA